MLEGIKEYRIKINIEKTKIIRINNSENMIDGLKNTEG